MNVIRCVSFTIEGIIHAYIIEAEFIKHFNKNII